MNNGLRAVALAAVSLIAALCTAAADAALPAGRQAAYDAAQIAFDKRDWNGAIQGFSSLLPADPARPLGRSEAVIATRLGYALVHVGRDDEARVVIARALPALSDRDGALYLDALMAAGDAARFSFAYADAADAYRRAYALARTTGDTADMITAMMSLAYAATTIDPVSVASGLDAILGDKAMLAALDRKQVALIEDLRARAAINAGDLATALKWSDRAVAQSGGLTPSVSVGQVAIRNDAAIVASLRKDDENARKFLAYTGAGHIGDTKWIGRYDGELPVCNESAGVRPQDSVVIQFAIADDGRVEGALPIYATHPGALGATFARAVSQWRWNPDLLKPVALFWRATLVLELRCQSRPRPTELGRPVWAAFSDWLDAHHVDTSADDKDVFVSANDPRLARDDIAAIPALLARFSQDHAAKATLAARLRNALDANAAPPSAYALMIAADAENQAWNGAGVHAGARARAAKFAASVPAFQARYPGDLATAWLDLQWAFALEDSGDFRSAQPLLRSVLATPADVLAGDAPIRKVALLHNALAAGKLGDSGTAQTGLAESGLDADQCSLFDTHPIPASVAIGSAQFPAEALRWNFEGYVDEAFDIGDDGHVANIRTVVAYPPFVFAPATESAVRSFRYVPPRIGGKSVGCSGKTESVSYSLSH